MSTQPTLKLIGISGKKRHGKDTIADMLIMLMKPAGITRATKLNFADAVYEQVAEVIRPHLNTIQRCYNTKALVEYIKKNKDQYRLLLQWWGTDFRRKQNPDYWVEEWLYKCGVRVNIDELIIASDVRFLNEAEKIRELGGTLIRVSRDGLPRDNHPSETELDSYKHFDHFIYNDGTLEQLSQTVKQLITKL